MKGGGGMGRMACGGLAAAVASCVPLWAAAAASDYDEFKVKREPVFEFVRKPVVSRQGDRCEIRFETKGLCDVTVAVEERASRNSSPATRPRIVRHLACGVLGPNAPEPFQRNSRAQVLVWDGKDDQGRYVDEKEDLAVRVSLGLRPVFERTLFWHPAKRLTGQCPRIAAAEDGVYVYQGAVVDSVRVFDHQGNYVRTVYPFPADQLDRVLGLHLHDAPQDGARLPLKEGHHQATLLSSGVNAGFDQVGVDKHNNYDGPVSGNAAMAIAVRAGRLALVHRALNRLATDGTTGGLPLSGPEVTFPMRLAGNYRYDGKHSVRQVSPTSAALSPDGKTLYLAGYLCREIFYWEGLHGVVRVPFDGDAPAVFAGSMKQEEFGADNAHFRVAASVACDPAGRVYVADYMNDRVQVYSPEGRYLKTIPAVRPAMIQVHQRTGELYVFSWTVQNGFLADEQEAARKAGKTWTPIKPTLTRFGPFDAPVRRASYDLPVFISHGAFSWLKFPPAGLVFLWAELDSWTDPPTIWFGMFRGQTGEIGIPAGDGGLSADPWERTGIVLLSEENGKLVVKRDFGAEVKQAVVRSAPTTLGRQRLVVNPANHQLYVLEGDGAVYKSVLDVLRIDPETGAISSFELPYDAEDLAFDQNGLAYLRGLGAVGRYDPSDWREVPWDYGEQRDAVNMNNETGRKRRAPLRAGLIIPVGRYNHQGGLYVSPTGHIVVCSYFGQDPLKLRNEYATMRIEDRAFAFPLYPGRLPFALVNIWDQHGRIVHADALKGMGFTNGIAIDQHDNIYVMASANRILDGQPYFNAETGTMMKFKPGAGRILGTHRALPIPLPIEERPKRPADVEGEGGGRLGRAWVEGAEWFYGGVGFHGRSQLSPGYGCDCWNARFAFDYFDRSFAPEIDHYSVAALDSSGNLILRIGRYGNVDDGKPLIAAGGPPTPRSIGGDEVALFHAAYVGADTDRRLFIADAGNSRILSIRLDYHASARVLLKDIPGAGQ
jgi:hypothetical protein